MKWNIILLNSDRNKLLISIQIIKAIVKNMWKVTYSLRSFTESMPTRSHFAPTIQLETQE